MHAECTWSPAKGDRRESGRAKGKESNVTLEEEHSLPMYSAAAALHHGNLLWRREYYCGEGSTTVGLLLERRG